ncbi:nuclear transport factor 2 family protein [Rhodococcus sp. UNC363MFTsu5.1]|uniref:nuclear transport factor 2 family protein n=1 Tax=Rhodococcus sp. UNC363MFTsu5.1 TaxID=1449069 RepID=UPI000486D4A3|nr:nuclear transport factor 2 family protein [Rhodococcus sp. UNC363MFTsu5.1]
MSETIVRLMEENLLAVFNERDPQRRLTVVRRNYAPDVRWSDPEETVVGRDRLHEKAQELLDGPLSGLTFTQSGSVHQTANLGLLAFDVVPLDRAGAGSREPLISGYDVAIVEDDVIAQLFTVITKSPR